MTKWGEAMKARQAAGLCRHCGKCGPVEGRKLCGPCLTRQNDRLRKRRQERVARGLCANCGLTAPKGERLCEKHRAESRACLARNYEKRKAARRAG